MIKTIKLINAVLLAAAAFSAFAASDFKIAGGGGVKNGSLYSLTLGDIAAACNTDQTNFVEVNSNGSPNSLQLLKSNAVGAAVVQSDVIAAQKLENPSSIANLRVVAALHHEAIHLIVRADSKTEGGTNIPLWGNVGGKDVVYNNPEDLKGRRVGAVGGSLLSMRIVSDLLKYNWIPAPYDSTAQLLDALSKHQIDAAVIVAGIPSPAVQKISGPFKLLPLRGNSDTAAVYQPFKVTYENLNQGRSVDTLTEQAVLITHVWHSPEAEQRLANLRSCIASHVNTWKDESQVPTWQDIKANDQGPSPDMWYSLSAPVEVPVVAQVPVSKAKAPKK